MAAPAEEASGTSASIAVTEGISATAAGGPGSVRVETRTLRGVHGPAFAVYAPPALITLLAAHFAFSNTAPDLVLSGINRGANIGKAILHSGTVGAALTGGVSGARGLAVSLATERGSTPRHWSTAATVASRVIPVLMQRPPGTVFNVNVPDVPWAENLEIVEARLAPFGIARSTMIEYTGHRSHVLIVDPEEEHTVDTDAALLAAGSATVTGLSGIGEIRIGRSRELGSEVQLLAEDDRPQWG